MNDINTNPKDSSKKAVYAEFVRKTSVIARFCDEYAEAAKASKTDAYFERLREERPDDLKVIADICDQDASEIDAFDIQNTAMLRVYIILRGKEQEGVLSKTDLRCMFNTLVNVDEYELAKPLDDALAAVLLIAMNKQFNRVSPMITPSTQTGLSVESIWGMHRMLATTTAQKTVLLFKLMGSIVTFQKPSSSPTYTLDKPMHEPAPKVEFNEGNRG